jgi:hypothetical protein
MQGHGASHVLVLPDEIIVVRFMDGYATDFRDLVRRGAMQVPVCS